MSPHSNAPLPTTDLPSWTLGDLVIALSYIRLSSEEQRKRGIAPQTQKDLVSGYLSRLDPPVVVGECFEDVMTGLRDDRPAWRRLLARARTLVAEGKRVIIVAMRVDRLGRDEYELQRTWKETQQLGIAIHTVDHNEIKDATMFGMYAVFAGHEVRLLSAKVKNRHEKVMAAGYWPCGPEPFGYAFRDATPAERAAPYCPVRVLDVVEEAAWIVREIYRRIAAGESLHSVARWATTLPAALGGGSVMNYMRIRRIATSPLYIARFGRTATPGGTVLARPVGQWPALVTDEEWLAVATAIASHGTHPHQATGSYLLTGYLKCPRCDGRVTATHASNTPAGRYVCQRRVRTTEGCTWTADTRKVDGPLRLLLAEALGRIAAIPHYRDLEQAWDRLHEAPAEPDGEAEQVRALEALVRNGRAQLATALEQKLAGLIEQLDYDVLAERRRAEIHAAEAELGRRQGLEPAVVTRDQVRPIWEAAKDVARRIWTEPARELRPLLENVLERVDVEKLADGTYAVRPTWTRALRDVLEAEELVRVVPPKGMDTHVQPPGGEGRASGPDTHVHGGAPRPKVRMATRRARVASGLDTPVPGVPVG